jgi:hypothetical protein
MFVMRGSLQTIYKKNNGDNLAMPVFSQFKEKHQTNTIKVQHSLSLYVTSNHLPEQSTQNILETLRINTCPLQEHRDDTHYK